MVLPLPLFLSLGFTSNGWLHPASHSLTQFSLLFSSFKRRKKRKKTTKNHRHPALKKRKRKAKTLYLQGKRANADTDPASTLRMNLDPGLGEKKEKREENEVNPLGPWKARKGHLGKREKGQERKEKRKKEGRKKGVWNVQTLKRAKMDGKT